MIVVKNVSIRDIDDIFEWRNDPISRKFSLNTKPISKSTHVKWFKESLQNKRNNYFICYKNKNKIGFVKYENDKKNNCFVSINLNPKFRGKGLSSKILISTLKQKELKKQNTVFAKIKKNNTKSLKSFKKAGYTNIKVYKNHYLFRKTIKHDNLTLMKNSNFKKYESIISQIEKIRSKNNSNWMDILKIAFKNDPKASAKVMSKIYMDDQKISKLAKKLGK
jgi:RimJ/RimL family protein N-acetyltransferase